MAEFDPGQLDQLEDALELIDDLDDLESLELSTALGERLGEYQDVLALCREAFPVEEPAPNLLADVIAEAHEVSRRPRRDVEASGWQSFWERWRGTLVPGFALAGTAAAVLWILGPDPSSTSASELLDSRQDERSSEGIEPPSTPAGEAREGSEPDERERLEAGEEANETKVEDPQLGAGEQLNDEPAEDEQLQPKKPAKKKATPEPEPEPEPAPEPLQKEDAWKELERGNTARSRGDCDTAFAHYESVIAAASDTTAIARAHAGIGLCFEQMQRYSEADKKFATARSRSPSIDAWINGQRDEQPLPGEKKKKSKKMPSKKKSGMKDPFDPESL